MVGVGLEEEERVVAGWEDELAMGLEDAEELVVVFDLAYIIVILRPVCC